MAFINDIYVFVENETTNREVEGISHPAEKGADRISNVKIQPITLSLSGKLVKTDALAAYDARQKLTDLMLTGALVEYKGVNHIKNMQIRSLNTVYSSSSRGGGDFTMELEQVRTAKSPYVSGSETANTIVTNPVTNAGLQQIVPAAPETPAARIPRTQSPNYNTQPGNTLILAGQGPGSSPENTYNDPALDSVQTVVYETQPGDSLYSLSNQYKASIKAEMQLTASKAATTYEYVKKRNSSFQENLSNPLFPASRKKCVLGVK